MKLVQLGDYYFNYELITAVRESPLDDEQTIVFTAGQSAVDGGFLIDLPIEEVLEVLEEARLQLLTGKLDIDSELEEGEDTTAPLVVEQHEHTNYVTVSKD